MGLDKFLNATKCHPSVPKMVEVNSLGPALDTPTCFHLADN